MCFFELYYTLVLTGDSSFISDDVSSPFLVQMALDCVSSGIPPSSIQEILSVVLKLLCVCQGASKEWKHIASL